jgi:hypothetical protein
MTMRDRSHASATRVAGRRSPALRSGLAGLLGAAAALLISCGSSGKGLIPLADAGPLKGDFQAVQRAAEHGNGNCAETERAILKTENDYRALPGTLDGGLHKRLQEGIENLRVLASSLCAQPLQQATVTGSSPRTTPTTSTTTTPTTTQTTPTQTTPTQTTTTPTTTERGGGTPAPGGGTGEPPGEAQGGGTEPGGGGQEGGK